MVRPAGPAGTAASSIWNVGPFSISATVLCGYVVALTCGVSSARATWVATRGLAEHAESLQAVEA
eukprot:15434674-Alexandrium_andersonii.AAC.1